MENLGQVLYNFHRNEGAQPCVSITPTVSCSTNLVKNNCNNTSTGNIQQHYLIQMPLLGSTSIASSMTTGVATSISNSSATTPLTLNQQHVVLMPPSLVGDINSEVEQHRIKAQVVQQRMNPTTNMPPMNMPLTNMEHSSLDGVIGNEGEGVVAATIGAAGGEGSSSTAASAANKSSDDSSDCQG